MCTRAPDCTVPTSIAESWRHTGHFRPYCTVAAASQLVLTNTVLPKLIAIVT